MGATKSLIIAAAFSIMLAGTTTQVFGDHSATFLEIRNKDGDEFYNWDFEDQVVSSSGVDWPLNFIHHNNADVDTLKDAYYGNCGVCNPQHARFNDVGTWSWDEDRGTKKGGFFSEALNENVYLHMRLYGTQGAYLHNSVWNQYVLGTTHYDEYPGEAWSGYSEYAEDDWILVADANGYTTSNDAEWMNNAETFRTVGKHIVQSNGYATLADVP